MLFADVIPNGHGGFTVVPKKPSIEISSKQAAKILNMARSSLSNLLNQPKAMEIIKWRWLSEKKGKRVFELESVIAYREATKDSEFGECREVRTGAKYPSQ
jgi:hypothetical protein